MNEVKFAWALDPGTIMSRHDYESETWSFRVVGCACLLPGRKHATLAEAEDCSSRVLKDHRGPKPERGVGCLA